MHLQRLSRRASGFTLIELLLVITIMIVLLSLIIGVAMKGTAWVYQRNTELTFKKVNERLNRHVVGLPNEARQWQTPAAILAQANGDTQRAEVLKIKYLYKWSFPASYSEARANYLQSLQLYGNSGYPLAAGMYQQLVERVVNPALPTSLNAAQQNSVLLLLAFEKTKGSSVDELTPSETAQQDANAVVPAGTSNDRNRWLVDAWGTPILFLRNGTLNMASTSPENPFGLLGTVITPATNAWLIEKAVLSYGAKQGADPEDPGNVLRDVTWLTNPVDNSASWNFGSLIPPYGPLPPNNNNLCFQNRFFHDVTAGVYAPMVLFSAGPDRNFSTFYDNFTSYGIQLNVSQSNN